MANEFIIKNGFRSQGNSEITGSTKVAGNVVISGSTTSDLSLVQITQTGTGRALVVEDSASPDSSAFVVDNTGRVIIGATTAILPTVQLTISGSSGFILAGASGSVNPTLYVGNYDGYIANVAAQHNINNNGVTLSAYDGIDTTTVFGYPMTSGSSVLASLTGGGGSKMFIGTETQNDVIFGVHSDPVLRLIAEGPSAGNVHIDSATATIVSGSLLISGSTSTTVIITGSNTNSIIDINGNINNYAEINIQNRNSGNNASSDLVATNDTGNDTGNFVDLGINSSTFAGAIGGPNDAYLYNTGSNFYIGNSTSGNNSNIYFAVQNEFTTPIMTISSSRQVRINTSLLISGSVTGSSGNNVTSDALMQATLLYLSNNF